MKGGPGPGGGGGGAAGPGGVHRGRAPRELVRGEPIVIGVENRERFVGLITPDIPPIGLRFG